MVMEPPEGQALEVAVATGTIVDMEVDVEIFRVAGVDAGIILTEMVMMVVAVGMRGVITLIRTLNMHY